MLKKFGKSVGKHKIACPGLEQWKVDLRYVEARNRATHRRVLLGEIEADRLKKVACLWNGTGGGSSSV